jgi:hypothetical protein
MNKKLSILVDLLKEDLKLFISVSLGVFLFVLFFQPFPIDRFDFNNKILYVAGFGAIVFVFMILVRVFFLWLIKNHKNGKNEPIVPYYINGFIIMVLTSLAFTFYLYYVGKVSPSVFIIFKVVLICFVTVIILRVRDVINDLHNQNESLIIEKKLMQKEVEKYEDDLLNMSIEFPSENNSENLKLSLSDIVFIKSADNYVEIAYKEGDDFKKKLLRNTLKNIELQLKPYSCFVRCHRISIVNIHHVEKLNRSDNNNYLIIKGYVEQIPVSRQYLVKLKESL